MAKAEKFIEDYTRNCSNEMVFEDGSGSHNYDPWLTPDEARKAVEIAMEEMIEWLKENADKYIVNTTPYYPDADFSATIGGVCWEEVLKRFKI